MTAQTEASVLAVMGGSRGIGAAVARLGAGLGYRVVIGFRANSAAADAVVADIVSPGGRAMAIPVDAGNHTSVERFFGRIEAEWGVPTGFVHCAASRGPDGALIDIAPEHIDDAIRNNLTGTFFCVRAAARRMALSRGGAGGAIVLLSSEAARFGGRGISPYAASKAGVNTLTIGVARELAPDGVRLNAVSPGSIDTEWHASLPEATRAALVSSIPIGRLGRPDEVARTVLWLLSAEASYITGTVIAVAGGR